jgi:hypothetical protein
MLKTNNYTNSFVSAIKNKNTIEVQVGSSNYAFVDLIRNILSIPKKFLLLNSNINSGNVSNETIEKMREYLDANGLHDVAISVNQYKPQWIWDRIFTNPKTSVLSKCTIGFMHGLYETFSIPKLTGGDHYDFASNTIHLFSNDASAALHACGHAKDYNQQEYPTLYALTKALPLVGPLANLYQEAVASENAITYLREKKSGEGVRQAFTLLIPAFFSHLAKIALKPKVSPLSLMLFTTTQTTKNYVLRFLGIMAIGHCLGRIMASLESDPTSAKEEKKNKQPSN